MTAQKAAQEYEKNSKTIKVKKDINMAKSKAQIKLKAAGVKLGIVSISKKLGISRETYYNLINGESNPENMKLYVARALKNVLNIEYEDWFEVEADYE